MPVPRHIKFLVGYAGEPAHIIRNRQDAEQARCLFHDILIFLWGGHLARP
ncbi:hypothetical protein [Microcoleus sp. B4-C1]